MYTSKMIPCINILIVLLIVPFCNASVGHDYYYSNVEEILDSEPNLSEFRKYLIETGISCQIINGYWGNGITILALTNSAMLPLVSEISFSGAGMSPFDPYPFNSALRGILSLHIIPHYYDGGTLRRAQNNSAITNMNRYGDLVPEPSVNVLKLIKYEGGDVGLVSAVPGSEPVYYVKEIKTLPTSISVLQISSPIIVPAFLINIITVLQKHGCNTFAELISSRIYPKGDYDNLIYTIDDYYSLVRSGNGITIFAPSDVAMKSTNISEIENDVLYFSLQLHALDFYAPIETLEHYNESFRVDFIEHGRGWFILNFSSSGHVVKLHTGSVDAKITSTLFDLPQLIIYSVDHFLLGKVFTDTPSPLPPSPEPTPTPAPAPFPSPAPTPTPSPIPPPSPFPLPAPTPTPPPAPTPPLPSPAPSTPPSASPPPPFPRPTPTPPLPSPTPTPTPAPAPSPKSLPPTPAPAPSPKSLPPAPTPTPAPAPTPMPTPAPNNGGGGRKDGNMTRNAGFMIMVLVFVISFVI